ncbi:hypothetical protein M409DRAFT_18915 [Zasmidium cellare ATCC 36951]|uniref:Uncharacterized protein n=1 Tax=Zasmidium cellare ATCC 36951 TaxID=1080233 RepID=A0A6A6CUV4_ZASCE|nr:uncharacterized protein M409DRAFT_18915 [Zasmidium cellare ATCC 36951]KAF2170944.1 hypothetical protein M409DRAFT_18915 [Zasmidium cellare ATCC 36951]
MDQPVITPSGPKKGRMLSRDWSALDDSQPQATTATGPSEAQSPDEQGASQPSTSQQFASTPTVHATATTSSTTDVRAALDNISSINSTGDIVMMEVDAEMPRRNPTAVDDNDGDYADDELAGRKDARGRISEGEYGDVLETSSITAEMVEDMKNLLPAVCQRGADYAGPSETLFDRLVLNMVEAQKCHNILLRNKSILVKVTRDTCMVHRMAMRMICDLEGAEEIVLPVTRQRRTLKDRARVVAGKSNLLDTDAQDERRAFAQRIISKALDDTDPVMRAGPGSFENVFRTLMAVVHCKYFTMLRVVRLTVHKLRRELRTHIEEYISTSAKLAPWKHPTTRRHAQSLLFPEDIPELPKGAQDDRKRQ